MSNFIQRTLSGAVFILIIISAILIPNSYVFMAVFAILCGWTLHEFHTLTNNGNSIAANVWVSVFCGVLLFVLSYLGASQIIGHWVFAIYAVAVTCVVIFELFRKKENPINNWAYFFLGQIYVAAPFSLLNFILYPEVGGYQPIILLSVFVIIWVNDTAAYLFGVSLGKHRMFERISPKKSWEGFIGGALITLLSGYVFSRFIPELSLIQWIILAEIIIIFGTFGDLVESLLKRTLNVKDSGNLIPGHGGLLDRLDSMLLAAPAVFAYFLLMF